MQIDWGNGIITGVIALCGGTLGQVIRGAKTDQRVDNLETEKERTDKLNDAEYERIARRIDQHDAEFKDLPVKFVPRLELQAKLDNIQHSQADIQGTLNWLVWGKEKRNARGPLPPAPSHD